VNEVRPVVRERARQLGPAGRRWLAGLPALVDGLAREWSITVGAPLPGGTASYVTAAARRTAGTPCGRLWEELGRPCPERVIARALSYANRRAAAFDPDRCVVVHGDPHPGNALRVPAPRPGAESGYVFVDPDGFLADPAYDLGVVLRDWCAELLAGDAPALARRYCRLLAGHSGVDEAAIWEWGYLERVSTGLFVAGLGEHELARPYLHTALLLAGEDGPGQDWSDR
jgi:streptomycin 6-kinase